MIIIIFPHVSMLIMVYVYRVCSKEDFEICV